MAIDVNELHTLCKALDKMITSERKEVKDAFRELAIMVTLIDSDDKTGPLTQLVKNSKETEHRISVLERRLDEYDRREREDRRYRNPYDRDRIRWEHNNPFLSTSDGTSKMTTEEFQKHIHGLWTSKDIK